MTDNSISALGKNKHPLTYKDLITEERLNQLKQTLEKYRSIVEYYSEGGDEENVIYPSHLIKDAFTFEKPLTSIEHCNLKGKNVSNFIEDMKKFFFVTHNSDFYQVHVSRFRTISRLPTTDFGEGERKIKFTDNFADFVGLTYGYSAKQIANYCLKEKKYDLIK